ncbi:hypothetical protein GCM10027360_25680 [Amycolatopsis echigonensis]
MRKSLDSIGIRWELATQKSRARDDNASRRPREIPIGASRAPPSGRAGLGLSPATELQNSPNADNRTIHFPRIQITPNVT